MMSAACLRQALSSSTSALSNKKQREVYVGNLTIGVVTDIMLRDLFNASLAHLCGIEVAPGQDISGAQRSAGSWRPYHLQDTPAPVHTHMRAQHQSASCCFELMRCVFVRCSAPQRAGGHCAVGLNRCGAAIPVCHPSTAPV